MRKTRSFIWEIYNLFIQISCYFGDHDYLDKVQTKNTG